MTIIKTLLIFFSSLFLLSCDADDPSYFHEGADAHTPVIIQGQVRDYLTQNLLQDVNISFELQESNSTLSDINGSYSLSFLSQSDYILDFNKTDYYPIQYSIHTTKETNQTLQTVYLVPITTTTTSSASGTISSLSTGENLEDVNLSLRTGLNNQTSDVLYVNTTLGNGSYSFSDIEINTYTMQIQAQGYITSFETLYVVAGQSGLDQNFSISPEIFSVDGNNSTAGVISSATTGIALNDVLISLRLGLNTKTGAILASTITENNGSNDGLYGFSNIAVGDYTAEISLNGYVTGYETIKVLTNETNANNFVISPELTSDEAMRLILTWGETPRDLDSYLLITKDDGTTSSVYYGNREVTDYAKLDIDKMAGYGPETITINYLSSGKYIYYIDRFSSGDLNTSKASVQVIRAGEDTLVVDINTTGDDKYWEVLHIDNGVVNVVNQIGSVPSL